MKPEDKTKYVKFLNEHKKLVGLSDWKLTITKDEDISDLANVDVDIYEKELSLTLSADFHKLSATRKKNVLLHELVHGRIEIFNKKREILIEELEEELANDITRGFERHNNLVW